MGGSLGWPRLPGGRLGLVVVLALVVSRAATASEESKRLYMRGMVELNAGHAQEALRLYDRAVAADPNDPYALYYRGIARSKLDDLAGATADLRTVVAMPGAPQEATLELGVLLVQETKYREAVPWLERAQRVPSLEARASLFLGIAELRLGQITSARDDFQRAAQEDSSLRVPARYYQGVVAYEQGRLHDAEGHFAYVATYSSNSDMGREAALFLDQIRRAQGPIAELYGAVGLEYDSNVVLAPNDDIAKSQLAISNQADGRATITAGGTYVPWQNEYAQLAVGYEFYQSLHFQLTNFNLQDHRPSAQFVINVDRYQFGLFGRYDYYLLETNSFLQEGTGLPWIAANEGDFGRTEIFYRVRRRDFKQQAYSETRNAFNHAAGIRQLFYLGSPDRYVWIGYRYDHESPVNGAGNVFAYDGNEGGGGVEWTFPADITANASYAYRNEAYDSASKSISNTGEGDNPNQSRRDQENQIIVALSKQLTGRLAVTAAFFATLNDSNKVDFYYDRYIGALALEVRFY